MSASSSFSCRGEWGGGGGRGRPGLVMNALTITHFKSRVYPWGMEKLVHRLGGNCLFLWPAAKGEEVNGKRYESVCPLRWWIRCKLEEEAFWSWALWLFLFLPLKIVFCLLLHSPFPAFVSFFGIFLCFFSHFFFIFSISAPSTVHGLWGCVGWQVELWEVRRARAAFADCGTESWDSTAFSENTVCSKNREAVQSHREPWPWAVSREDIDSNPSSLTQKHRPSCPPNVCTHSHMVFCSKWIRQNPSWIIMKGLFIAVHHWEINKLVFLSCLPFIDIHECHILLATKGLAWILIINFCTAIQWTPAFIHD